MAVERSADGHAAERAARATPRSPVGVGSLVAPTRAILLAEEVVDRLRDAILRGHFAPGDRLREEQLASALGVSRGPIRDALVQLEREGLAVRRPNRGAVVAKLSRSDLEEVFSLRQAIEPVCCAWAARHADARDLAEMQAVIDGYANLTTKSSAREAAEVDLAFHDVVYRAARHRRLLGLWEDLRPQVYVFMLARTYVHTPGFREIMIRNHAAILAVIAEGDDVRAGEVAGEHVRTSYVRVLSGDDGLASGLEAPRLLER